MAKVLCPDHEITGLGTTLSFMVEDCRGFRGFPDSPQGLVYWYFDNRVIPNKFTGVPTIHKGSYVIRTGSRTPREWRIDLLPNYGPAEAVYGPNGEAYFPTERDAAQALRAHLENISNNSTLG
jgi:hypothetical protein